MNPLFSIPLGVAGTSGLLLYSYYQFSSIAFKSASRADENGFFILMREGEARSVIRGGTHYKTLMAYEGHTIGRKETTTDGRPLPLVGDGFDYEYVIPTTTPTHPRLRQHLQRMNWLQGIGFVGILKGTRLYRYPFAWMSFKRGLMSESEKPFKQHDEKILSYIYVQPAVYVFQMKTTEVAGDFPHDIWILVTIQVTNPARALHRTPFWLDTTIGILEPQLRELLGQFTPTEINSGSLRSPASVASQADDASTNEGKHQQETRDRLARLDKRLEAGSDDDSDLSKHLKDLCEHVTYNEADLEKSTELKSGAAVRSIAIFAADPSDSTLRDALLANEKARLQGEAEFTSAEFAAKAKIRLAEGDKKAIELVREATKDMTPDERVIALANIGAKALVDAAEKGARVIVNTGPQGFTSSLLATNEIERT
jgi:regulator of protease activity HflC (stomatin/prohibitin superfamily)